MYLFFTIILPLFLLLFFINLWRRKKIIQKVRALCTDEKYQLLNEIIEPFGYSYSCSQDLFSSRIDAWQRSFGYGKLYDNAASHLGMVFDCLPIYFNYQGKTWLLELWKGQYGINTGCEMGIYYADRILSDDELENTIFQSVNDSDMLPMSFTLQRMDDDIASLAGKHWWLTAFRMGCFSQPYHLRVHASVTFPTSEMTNAFTQALLHRVPYVSDIHRHCNRITFSFSEGIPVTGFLSKLSRKISQWNNRFWCEIFLSVTKPFTLSTDRILYLYYYLPFAFRRILGIHKYKKRNGGSK